MRYGRAAHHIYKSIDLASGTASRQCKGMRKRFGIPLAFGAFMECIASGLLHEDRSVKQKVYLLF